MGLEIPHGHLACDHICHGCLDFCDHARPVLAAHGLVPPTTVRRWAITRPSGLLSTATTAAPFRSSSSAGQLHCRRTGFSTTPRSFVVIRCRQGVNRQPEELWQELDRTQQEKQLASVGLQRLRLHRDELSAKPAACRTPRARPVPSPPSGSGGLTFGWQGAPAPGRQHVFLGTAGGRRDMAIRAS